MRRGLHESGDHISAVRMQDLARDVSRIGAREEDEARGDLDGLAWAIHGHVLSKVFLRLFRHGCDAVVNHGLVLGLQGNVVDTCMRGVQIGPGATTEREDWSTTRVRLVLAQDPHHSREFLEYRLSHCSTPSRSQPWRP